MIKKVVKKKAWTLSWIPLLFVTTFIFRYMGMLPVICCNVLYIFVSVVGIFYIVGKRCIRTEDIYCIILCLLIVISGISSGMHTGLFQFSLYYKSLCYLFLAVFLLKSHQSRVLTGAAYYFISFIFIAVLLTRDIEEANKYFTSLSRNYYSVLSLAMLILYYLSMNINGKDNIPLAPAIVYLIITILAIGRGGIITGLIIVLGIIFINDFLNKTFKYKAFSACIASIFMSILIVVGIRTQILNKFFSRFLLRGLASEGRQSILQTYFIMINESFSNLILGASNRNAEIFLQYDGNLHNTFLQMHSTYGLIFSIIVIGGLFFSFIDCYKKKQYIIVLLELAFIVRALIDWLGYSFFTEFLLYYFSLYSSMNRGNEKYINTKGIHE